MTLRYDFRSRLPPFEKPNGGQRVDTSRSRFLPTTTSELLETPPPLMHARAACVRRAARAGNPVTRPTGAGWWIAAGVLVALGAALVEISCRAGCWGPQ